MIIFKETITNNSLFLVKRKEEQIEIKINISISPEELLIIYKLFVVKLKSRNNSDSLKM